MTFLKYIHTWTWTTCIDVRYIDVKDVIFHQPNVVVFFRRRNPLSAVDACFARFWEIDHVKPCFDKFVVKIQHSSWNCSLPLSWFIIYHSSFIVHRHCHMIIVIMLLFYIILIVLVYIFFLYIFHRPSSSSSSITITITITITIIIIIIIMNANKFVYITQILVSKRVIVMSWHLSENENKHQPNSERFFQGNKQQWDPSMSIVHWKKTQNYTKPQVSQLSSTAEPAPPKPWRVAPTKLPRIQWMGKKNTSRRWIDVRIDVRIDVLLQSYTEALYVFLLNTLEGKKVKKKTLQKCGIKFQFLGSRSLHIICPLMSTKYWNSHHFSCVVSCWNQQRGRQYTADSTIHWWKLENLCFAEKKHMQDTCPKILQIHQPHFKDPWYHEDYSPENWHDDRKSPCTSWNCVNSICHVGSLGCINVLCVAQAPNKSASPQKDPTSQSKMRINGLLRTRKHRSVAWGKGMGMLFVL